MGPHPRRFWSDRIAKDWAIDRGRTRHLSRVRARSHHTYSSTATSPKRFYLLTGKTAIPLPSSIGRDTGLADENLPYRVLAMQHRLSHNRGVIVYFYASRLRRKSGLPAVESMPEVYGLSTFDEYRASDGIMYEVRPTEPQLRRLKRPAPPR